MGSEGVFPAEMPDEPSQPIVPLDADTAERLLSGRLDPDDAPPGYAEVARLLQAAAAPADQVELAGQAAAMATFRTTCPRPAQPPGRPASPGRAGGARGRRDMASGPAPGARGRLVALALAGVVAAAGVGLWTAGGAPFAHELRSPSGGPSAAGPGSATPGSGQGGSGAYGSGAGAAGSLRPVGPGPDSATGTAPGRDGRLPVAPSASERATARHGGGVTSRGGSPHGAKPARPDKQAKPKPPKPKASKPWAPQAEASSAPKGPGRTCRTAWC
jgi:hypothetical protein